jgi:hypothetical protein
LAIGFHFAAAFHHCKHCLLFRVTNFSIRRMKVRMARTAANVCLVYFYNSRQWAEYFGGGVSHSEADAIEHEQAGLVTDSGLAVYLQRTYTFLAGRCPPEAKAPVAELDAGIFKDGARADGVLLFAVLAAPAVVSLALASLAVQHLVNGNGTTARAGSAISAPTLLFKELDGGLFVGASGWNLADDFVVFGAAVLNFGHGGLDSMTLVYSSKGIM